MKLLGIYMLRGWEDSSEQEDVIKAYSLIENTDTGQIFYDVSCIIDIPRSMKDRELDDVKKSVLISSLKVLKELYKINWKNEKTGDNWSFKVIYEDVSDFDIRASYPTTQFLKEVFISKLWSSTK